jgi:hypothetical protein
MRTNDKLNRRFLSIFTLRLAGKPAAQDKLTAKAVSANGEVDRPQDETEGFLRWRNYPSVSRFQRLPPPHLCFAKMERNTWGRFEVVRLNGPSNTNSSMN